jgi:SpoVK/Ycf46/Vps4 family AAA+-type ATPase
VPAFLACTCNALVSPNGQLLMPMELQRSGRIDATFFVGFPSDSEVEDIWKIHISKAREEHQGRNHGDYDIASLAKIKYVYEGYAYPYTGAEVEAAVLDALAIAFHDGRELSQSDLEFAIRSIKPVSYVGSSTMTTLYKFGKERCRPASSNQLAEPSSLANQSNKVESKLQPAPVDSGEEEHTVRTKQPEAMLNI